MIELAVSDEIVEKIEEAQANKNFFAKTEKEKKLKSGFMKDYIQSMSDSISARRVMFGQYFDTSSSIYQIYVNFIENDVANKDCLPRIHRLHRNRNKEEKITSLQFVIIS